jgi:4-diphosphocytidyl-2-C-methyl-D-erythritol kinase
VVKPAFWAQSMKKLRVRAPAKINLYLRVLGRRQDGYHELETVFQAVDLSDELFIEETSGPSTLQVPGHPHLETNGNLVLRSLRWMEERAQRPISVRMKLLKRIPEAAGLGGGSSDAAAALLGITALLDLGLQDHDLLQAAVGLGADVPFFLRGGTAVGEGIGERLTSVELPTTDYRVILVNPGFPVVTAAVFREYSKFLTGKMSQGTVWKVLRELQGVEDLLHNDLQAVAERLHPEITEVRRQMASAGVTKPLMSGSGPTVFGIGDPDRLVAIKEIFPPQWSTYVTKPLAAGVSID